MQYLDIDTYLAALSYSWQESVHFHHSHNASMNSWNYRVHPPDNRKMRSQTRARELTLKHSQYFFKHIDLRHRQPVLWDRVETASWNNFIKLNVTIRQYRFLKLAIEGIRIPFQNHLHCIFTNLLIAHNIRTINAMAAWITNNFSRKTLAVPIHVKYVRLERVVYKVRS